MATTPPPAGAGGLEAKHYVLAAFTAGFIAAAVVTTVFVVLSPAHIYFSVTSASSHNWHNGSVDLSLTISAQSTSRRAAVRYKMLFVDVSNAAGVDWVRADVVPADHDQPLPGGVREIHASVAQVGVPPPCFTGNKTCHSRFSVRVTAVARFKVGVARTRLYDIKVYCGGVDFFANNQSVACA